MNVIPLTLHIIGNKILYIWRNECQKLAHFQVLEQHFEQSFACIWVTLFVWIRVCFCFYKLTQKYVSSRLYSMFCPKIVNLLKCGNKFDLFPGSKSVKFYYVIIMQIKYIYCKTQIVNFILFILLHISYNWVLIIIKFRNLILV